MTQPSIECPFCKAVSYNSRDIEYKYCNNCHYFHGDVIAHFQGKLTNDNVGKIHKLIIAVQERMKRMDDKIV